jgi:putrescine transport system permease protein
MRRISPSLIGTMILGYLFLYVPIILVVIYSFNRSKLIGVWGGFSTHWYAELFSNTDLHKAILNSFKIASISATMAMTLGTLAAILLIRFPRFPGRTLFDGLITAPLVMPDVIMGLALLLMFVFFEQLMGWPYGRGVTTVTIAHITVGMAYVVVIVKARLAEFDRSLEEAALDLGATPAKVFFLITLPIIFPALAAGWLLAFTLSLDDLVIASFVNGPGATTLPMLVFSSVRLGVNPQINAFAALILLLVAVCVGIAGWIMHRRVTSFKGR